MTYFYWKCSIKRSRKNARPWRVTCMETELEIACSGTWQAAFNCMVRFQRAMIQGESYCIKSESRRRNLRKDMMWHALPSSIKSM